MNSLLAKKQTWKKISAFLLTLLFVVLPVISLVSTEIALAAGTEPTPIEAQAAKADTQQGAGDIDMMTRFGNFVGNLIISIGAQFTGFGGMLLDLSITNLVFGMGDIVQGNSFGATIDTLWTLIRDMANLAFIFGFIYAGISTIINSESSNTKRMLSSIIIGALLINFSLFFTKIVIDFSNFTALQIYQSMVDGTGTISGGFTQVMGMLDLRNGNGLSPQQIASVTTAGQITYFVLAAVFLMVAGFVFAAGAVLLVVRFVALIFIMIFSPLLFAATVFPKTAGYASKLWSSLFSYSFFAPVYLLLMLISLKIVQGLSTVLNGGNATVSQAVATGSADAFGVALIFVVATIFITMSLQLAQKMGMAGGSQVVSLGKDLRNYGQRAVGNSTFGAGAAFMRATAGRGGSALAENQKLRDKAATSWTARQALKLSRVAADSSFDARKVGGFGKNLGIGEGRKGGYETVQKEMTEKEKKFAQSLGEVGDDDVRVMARKREMQTDEKNLRRLEEELNAIDKTNVAARAAKREEIEKQKTKIFDSKTNYEKEKQRRVIGSTFTIDSNPTVKAEVTRIKNDVTTEKDELKKLWEGDPAAGTWAYTDPSLSDVERKLRRDDIQKQMKKIADLEKEIKVQEAKLDDRGYAGVLEKSRRLTAWPIGRLAHMEREAGGDVRKAAEKGLPKKKDD